jgi:hypothetical protein
MSKRNDAAAELDERLRSLAERAKPEAWNAFVEEMKVPSDIAVAMATGRPEMLRLAPARDMGAEEVRVLYGVIAGLLETNAALREHAQDLARLTDNWASAFAHLRTTGERIVRFAKFDHSGAATDDGEDGSSA